MSLTNLAVRVSEPAAEGERLRLEIEPMAVPAIGPEQCLIEVSAAGVDASDVKEGHPRSDAARRLAAHAGTRLRRVRPRRTGRADWQRGLGIGR